MTTFDVTRYDYKVFAKRIPIANQAVQPVLNGVLCASIQLQKKPADPTATPARPKAVIEISFNPVDSLKVEALLLIKGDQGYWRYAYAFLKDQNLFSAQDTVKAQEYVTKLTTAVPPKGRGETLALKNIPHGKLEGIKVNIDKAVGTPFIVTGNNSTDTSLILGACLNLVESAGQLDQNCEFTKKTLAWSLVVNSAILFETASGQVLIENFEPSTIKMTKDEFQDSVKCSDNQFSRISSEQLVYNAYIFYAMAAKNPSNPTGMHAWAKKRFSTLSAVMNFRDQARDTVRLFSDQLMELGSFYALYPSLVLDIVGIITDGLRSNNIEFQAFCDQVDLILRWARMRSLQGAYMFVMTNHSMIWQTSIIQAEAKALHATYTRLLAQYGDNMGYARLLGLDLGTGTLTRDFPNLHYARIKDGEMKDPAMKQYGRKSLNLVMSERQFEDLLSRRIAQTAAAASPEMQTFFLETLGIDLNHLTRADNNP